MTYMDQSNLVSETEVIGSTFQVRPGLIRGNFLGMVIASRDAFVLHIGARTPKGLADTDDVHVYDATLEDFDEFLKHRPYPFLVRFEPKVVVKINGMEVDTENNTIVVPRAAIERIHYGFWGTYDLVCKNRTYCIGLSMLFRSRKLARLKELGWDEKLDLAGSPSPLKQLAPLWGMLGGAIVAGGTAVLNGRPLVEGRDAAIVPAAVGAIVGLAAGGIIYALQKKS